MIKACSRRLILYGMWPLLAVVINACSTTSTPSATPTVLSPSASPTSRSSVPDTWTTYRNDEHNYSIDIAPDWEVDDSNKDEVIIFIGRSQGQAGLHILVIDWSSSKEEFAQENYKFHQRRAKVLFEPISRSEVLMVSGASAERFEYLAQNEAKFCIELLVDILVVARTRAYALQGTACQGSAPLYLGAIERMQRSFTLDSGQAIDIQDLTVDAGGLLATAGQE